MTYDATDRDGNVKTLPLFADIDIRTPKYIFSHPNGLLFATQFAQIALVVTEKAAFEDMRMKGFIQKDCTFPGHSLGEYSALASIADVLHISALVDVVFYRDIAMQRAVERDSENRSNYAMCAVNPSKISPSFTDAALRELVVTIAMLSNSLLEIVTYSIEVSFILKSIFLVVIDHASGSTICLCWRTSHPSDYDQCSKCRKLISQR